jgi:hypothetical protein
MIILTGLPHSKKQTVNNRQMKKVKKILALAAILAFVGASVSSCKATHDCSSYGEVKKYQQEIRR